MKRTINRVFYIDTFTSPELGEVIDKAREAGYRELRTENDMLVLERGGVLAYIISGANGHILWEKSARRR